MQTGSVDADTADRLRPWKLLRAKITLAWLAGIFCVRRKSQARRAFWCRLWATHLVHVAPAAAELDGGLGALNARVHRQDPIVAKELARELFKLSQHVVVKGARCQCQLAGLLDKRAHDPRVAVTLVHGRVGAQKVIIALAIHIPHVNALAPAQNDGQRMVVECAVRALEVHMVLRLGRQAGQLVRRRRLGHLRQRADANAASERTHARAR